MTERRQGSTTTTTTTTESERLLPDQRQSEEAGGNHCAGRCARAAVVLAAVAVLAATATGVALYVARHGGAGERVVAPSDARIEPVGRWDTRAAAAPAFAWSGSGFRAAVAGTAYATLLLAHNHTKDLWVRVWVDGAPQLRVPVARTAALRVPLGARAATHTIQLAKLSEARTGPIALTGLRLERRGHLVSPIPNDGTCGVNGVHNSATFYNSPASVHNSPASVDKSPAPSASTSKTTPSQPPPPLPSRYLEFVGDSITCGYGVLGPNATCPFTLETEDPTETYAWHLAEVLRARSHLVSWSGRGVAWNYACGDPGAEMPHAYRYLFGAVDGSEPAWACRGPAAQRAHADAPAAVVMYLGTNDATCTQYNATAFGAAYAAFWRFLRDTAYRGAPHAPQIAVLCGSTPACAAARDAVAAAADPHVRYFPLLRYTADPRLLGCVGHPNTAAQRLLAASVAQPLAAFLNWTDSFPLVPEYPIAALWGRGDLSSKDEKNNNNESEKLEAEEEEENEMTEYCGRDENTIILVEGVRAFPQQEGYNYSALDLAPKHCSEHFEDRPGLLHCPAVGTAVTACQKRGARVLLTLGGRDCAPGAYDLASAAEAAALAQELWDAYFSSDSSSDAHRPFDDAVLDGINLDIQQGTSMWYGALVKRLRRLHAAQAHASSRNFTVAVTTAGCAYPDPIVGPDNENLMLLDTIVPDYIAVRLTDAGCSIANSTLDDQLRPWFKFAQEKNTRIALVVPASASTTHFLDLEKTVQGIRSGSYNSTFAGIVFDRAATASTSLFSRTLNTLLKIEM